MGPVDGRVGVVGAATGAGFLPFASAARRSAIVAAALRSAGGIGLSPVGFGMPAIARRLTIGSPGLAKTLARKRPPSEPATSASPSHVPRTPFQRRPFGSKNTGADRCFFMMETDLSRRGGRGRLRIGNRRAVSHVPEIDERNGI